MKITTKTGFECDVDVDRLDDWEFAKAAAAASTGRRGADALNLTIFMVDHMLTKKDAERLQKHVKTEDGRVPTSKMMSEIEDILMKINAAKNS